MIDKKVKKYHCNPIDQYSNSSMVRYLSNLRECLLGRKLYEINLEIMFTTKLVKFLCRLGSTIWHIFF